MPILNEQNANLLQNVPANNEIRSKERLNEMYGELTQREQEVDSLKEVSKQRMRDLKQKLMEEVFKVMQDVGIDPNDTEAINQFLQSLEARNPDLKEIFNIAFSGLDSMGEEPLPPEQGVLPPSPEQGVSLPPSPPEQAINV